MKLEDHPLSAIFPLMADDEISALAEDIKANGQREPIWLLDRKILDGRNRSRACVLAGVEQRVELYEGDDPLGFVISKNLRRRHLDTSQRAMVAAKIATAKRGGDHSANLQNGEQEITRDDAAKLLNVSTRTVADAAKVLAHGVPALQKAVEKGEASASAAASVAGLPKKEQREAVKTGTVAEAAKERMEALRREKQRTIWINLIGTTSKSLKKKILENPDAFTDEMLLKSLPKCCKNCLRIGPPTRPCQYCEELRRPSLLEQEPEFPEDEVSGPKPKPHPFKKEMAALRNASAMVTKATKDRGQASERLNRYLSVNGLMEHKSEDRAYIPNVGVVALLDAAGKEGPELTDNQAKKLYEDACLGKPFIHLKTRQNRARKGRT